MLQRGEWLLRTDHPQSGMKYWEITADNLHDVGWSLGWVSAINSNGRTIWIVDAHRGDARHYVVRADEMVTAFVELESAIRACGIILTKWHNFR